MNLKKIEAKLIELEKRKSKLNTEEYKKLFQDTERLYSKILKNTSFRFSLTDHAVVEYMKDVENFLPPSQIKFNILYAVDSFFKKHSNIDTRALRNTIYKPTIEGITYVIKDNKIITVYKQD